ncbi:unnamed protein product [Rotaria sp. Silwood1]|nr:unnamed protein product [Rotaria sp. Silwood1]CAF1298572.1 unnamed protein product [Rotaria sp. Silwood1]CAF3417011.1 unnamed protein product [Rotaria sp. Silwood1]CAF4979496.1 unnamed protein product [Rotaria sp. Silwood1]CAF5019150.1 unnamed protein product [Rotaria sp. Silwood1]
MDTFYHGSQFVRDWLLAFTHGKLNVKFDAIFPALINGLKLVGRNEPERVVSNIVRELYSIKEETSKKKEWEKMQKLQDCCAKLYTKPCFLFRVVNTALRCDDRTKLNELGPYCYLVYNYIGRHTNQSMPFRHRLRQSVRVMDAQPMILYRGDAVCSKTLEEYKQAAGKKDKCFRWLPFVSTSLDRDIARNFGQNVLYNIEVQQYLSNDQFTYLNNNTYFENEKEILLKPGARFQVIKVEPDCQLKRQLVHIKIIPSFVSNLI